MYIFDPYTQNLVSGLRVTFVIWWKLRVNNLVWVYLAAFGFQIPATLGPWRLDGIPWSCLLIPPELLHSFSMTALVARIASTPVHGGDSGSWTRHHLKSVNLSTSKS